MLKAPVMVAARANWKPTMPEASFSRYSPCRTCLRRSPISMSLGRLLTATASVGPRAAPRASAAVKGMAGTIQCTTPPMENMVMSTSPMASPSTGRMLRMRAALSARRASSYSSGAMNSTRNRSALKLMVTVSVVNTSMRMPSTIWIRGAAIFGTNWPMTAETSTAASRRRMSSRVAKGVRPVTMRFPTAHCSIMRARERFLRRKPICSARPMGLPAVCVPRHPFGMLPLTNKLKLPIFNSVC